jgi:hypothetical protein
VEALAPAEQARAATTPNNMRFNDCLDITAIPRSSTTRMLSRATFQLKHRGKNNASPIDALCMTIVV